jgi:hypothetical protein
MTEKWQLKLLNTNQANNKVSIISTDFSDIERVINTYDAQFCLKI